MSSSLKQNDTKNAELALELSPPDLDHNIGGFFAYSVYCLLRSTFGIYHAFIS